MRYVGEKGCDYFRDPTPTMSCLQLLNADISLSLRPLDIVTHEEFRDLITANCPSKCNTNCIDDSVPTHPTKVPTESPTSSSTPP